MLEKLEKIFTISNQATPQPRKKHELSLYIKGKWHTLTFKPELIVLGKRRLKDSM